MSMVRVGDRSFLASPVPRLAQRPIHRGTGLQRPRTASSMLDLADRRTARWLGSLITVGASITVARLIEDAVGRSVDWKSLPWKTMPNSGLVQTQGLLRAPRTAQPHVRWAGNEGRGPVAYERD